MSKTLAEASKDYYLYPTSKNYIELRNQLFELEWRDIVEEIIIEEHKQINSDIVKGMRMAKDIVKNYMKQLV